MNLNELTRKAQDARMYRIAARDLRRSAKVETPSAMSAFIGLQSARKTDLLNKARKCEKNARIAERAIVRAADALINSTTN